MRIRLPFSSVSLPLALPFILVVIYEAYLIVGLSTGAFGAISTKGFSLFMDTAQPWRSLLGPLFKEFYALLGTRNGFPVFSYWLVCTAINAFLVFLVGAFVSLQTVSKTGAVLAGSYIIVCLLVWAVVLASVNTANLSGVTLIMLASPFGLFLSSLLGKLGISLAMLFNSVLLYCIGSLLGSILLLLKAKFATSNEFTSDN